MIATRGMLTWLLAFVLGSTSVWASNPSEPKLRQWTVDGVSREAMVYVPSTSKTQPTPVIFAFHGHGGTMRFSVRKFAFHELWPEAIVVYPQGLPTPGQLTDPEGKKPGWQAGKGKQNDRDLKFFDAMLASLKAENQVDAKRIYATGHSNGGGFTYLLWAERGDVFAAMAPIAAGPGRGSGELCPKPVLHVAGEKDPLVLYAWQKRIIDRVRQVNQCDESGKVWSQKGDLVATIYPSKRGTPVVSAIHPGGHGVPEGTTEMIVKFFREHAKP